MKTKLITIILIMACILCGCGNSEEGPNGTTETEREPELNENGKEEILLCNTGLSVTLQEMIVEYNTHSSRYEIVPVGPERGTSVDDYRTRLQLELSNGKGPDILSYYTLQNLEMKPFAEKGLLMDVTDFLEEQGNLVEGAVEFNRVNGRLYGVPLSFSIATFITSKRLAGSNEVWTKDTCMQVMQDSGASVFCESPYGWPKEESGLFVLNMLGVGRDGIQLFVNEEEGISSFEQQEFIEMLEFCKTYSDSMTEATKQERIASGEVAYVIGGVSGFKSFWYFDSLFGGNPVYIGYPSPQGGRFELRVASYYINSSSSHKEGALDFLSFLMSEEQQRKMCVEDHVFPVNKDLLETMWAEASEEIIDQNTLYIERGVEYSPRLMTDEEQQIFWNMLKNPVYYQWRNVIWDIVEEEAKPFFYGEKTAREVATIIDGKVQLYLDENR